MNKMRLYFHILMALATAFELTSVEDAIKPDSHA